MKTTVEIDDWLFQRAKKEMRRQGITLKALINQALQATLAPQPSRVEPFELNFPVVHDERPVAVDIANRSALYDLTEQR